ncbi:MAG: class I SAM-dependent methyltransferase [Candidatus Melainabacteria bacterium]|nr:class I SAM-dependent methyltransferase [Candidatus Melainabacteria bacterium]
MVVLNERVEILAKDKRFRDSFHVAVCRALGTVDVVAELALPLVMSHGWLLVQKSKRQVTQEVKLASRALPYLGGRLAEVASTFGEALGKDHVVLVVEKLSPTAMCYPRPIPQMRRRPLGTL